MSILILILWYIYICSFLSQFPPRTFEYMYCACMWTLKPIEQKRCACAGIFVTWRIARMATRRAGKPSIVVPFMIFRHGIVPCRRYSFIVTFVIDCGRRHRWRWMAATVTHTHKHTYIASIKPILYILFMPFKSIVYSKHTQLLGDIINVFCAWKSSIFFSFFFA